MRPFIDSRPIESVLKHQDIIEKLVFFRFLRECQSERQHSDRISYCFVSRVHTDIEWASTNTLLNPDNRQVLLQT